MDTKYDSREIYCRRLGHYLTFEYCRAESGSRPCRKILDCWYDKIPIGEYLRENYSPGEIAGIAGPPPAKAATLVDLIERARRRGEDHPRPEADGGREENGSKLI